MPRFRPTEDLTKQRAPIQRGACLGIKGLTHGSTLFHPCMVVFHCVDCLAGS